MPITAGERRGRLEDAYGISAGASPATSLRACLRSAEQSARSAVAGGSVRSTSGNGHVAEFAAYGPGSIMPTEVVQLYRSLIDDFDAAFNFLSSCCRFGLDAFNAEFTAFPNAPQAVGGPQVLIDSSGRWVTLCAQFGVNSVDIVGVAFSDIADVAIFLWLMWHIVAITEAQSDYSEMRVAGGSQFT